MNFGETYAKHRTKLPVGDIADKVCAALCNHSAVVVTAPPGAGKSTLLPLVICDKYGRGAGKVVLLEPRRIAARQIAGRMAEMTGTTVGGPIGYRVRLEKNISAETRIEVLTEGLLTRMIVGDPTLDGVSTVIFDEFHERSLNTDTALALVLETQRTIRPDLRIVIMSATMDTGEICKKLDAPLIESSGRMYDVEVTYEEEADIKDCSGAVCRTVRRAYRETSGDILVFLPGQKEIRLCMETLARSLSEEVEILPLYGQLDIREQHRAMACRSGGERKVVLATSIAETSLTIEGVTAVVDSGYCRRQVFDPHSGFSHLETRRISMDMARQRTGRAGRLANGVCYRLWSRATEMRMQECRTPEIMDADLATVALDIASWGGNNINRLPWLTMPSASHVKQAQELLKSLGALDDEGTITSFGKKMEALPCHPRIANMMVHAKSMGLMALAADVAAILEEKDLMAGTADADLNNRIEALRNARKSGYSGIWTRIIRIAAQYRNMMGVKEDNAPFAPYDTGALIADVFPERIAIQDNRNTYKLACGERAVMDQGDLLGASKLLAVAAHDRRIFLASPIREEDAANHGQYYDRVVWDYTLGRTCAIRELRTGAVVLSMKHLDTIPAEAAVRAAADMLKKDGRTVLDFSERYQCLRKRIDTAARWHPELQLPDVSPESVLDKAEEWLPVYIDTPVTIEKLMKTDLTKVVWGWLTYEQQQEVDDIAPVCVTVPTGSHIKIDYREGSDSPVLSVRLQECFGLTDTPRLDRGRRPVTMELLSPGFKPVQLTKDLKSFWSETYFEVRKELRRRYPKHYWPDNPLEAEAVRGVRRKNNA